MRRVTLVALVMALALAGAALAADKAKPKAKKAAKVNPNAVELFDGKSLEGWKAFVVDSATKMEDIWSVKDGILVCKGDPQGYLATAQDYEDFRLVVEWRWAPGGKPGNSGVLMRMSGDLNKMLPKCLEAQLKSGNAGDLHGFQGFMVEGDAARAKHTENHPLGGDLHSVLKIEGNEKEPGKWNRYEISLKGADVSVKVNGKEVNQAKVELGSGKIALQSEGGEIHFRTVRLIPIKARRS